MRPRKEIDDDIDLGFKRGIQNIVQERVIRELLLDVRDLLRFIHNDIQHIHKDMPTWEQMPGADV